MQYAVHWLFVSQHSIIRVQSRGGCRGRWVKCRARLAACRAASAEGGTTPDPGGRLGPNGIWGARGGVAGEPLPWADILPHPPGERVASPALAGLPLAPGVLPRRATQAGRVGRQWKGSRWVAPAGAEAGSGAPKSSPLETTAAASAQARAAGVRIGRQWKGSRWAAPQPTAAAAEAGAGPAAGAAAPVAAAPAPELPAPPPPANPACASAAHGLAPAAPAAAALAFEPLAPLPPADPARADAGHDPAPGAAKRQRAEVRREARGAAVAAGPGPGLRLGLRSAAAPAPRLPVAWTRRDAQRVTRRGALPSAAPADAERADEARAEAGPDPEPAGAPAPRLPVARTRKAAQRDTRRGAPPPAAPADAKRAGGARAEARPDSGPAGSPAGRTQTAGLGRRFGGEGEAAASERRLRREPGPAAREERQPPATPESGAEPDLEPAGAAAGRTQTAGVGRRIGGEGGAGTPERRLRREPGPAVQQQPAQRAALVRGPWAEAGPDSEPAGAPAGRTQTAGLGRRCGGEGEPAAPEQRLQREPGPVAQQQATKRIAPVRGVRAEAGPSAEPAGVPAGRTQTASLGRRFGGEGEAAEPERRLRREPGPPAAPAAARATMHADWGGPGPAGDASEEARRDGGAGPEPAPEQVSGNGCSGPGPGLARGATPTQRADAGGNARSAASAGWRSGLAPGAPPPGQPRARGPWGGKRSLQAPANAPDVSLDWDGPEERQPQPGALQGAAALEERAAAQRTEPEAAPRALDGRPAEPPLLRRGTGPTAGFFTQVCAVLTLTLPV